MNDPAGIMKTQVYEHMQEKDRVGQLSLAHNYDHVENVAKIAGILAPYFGRKLGVENPNDLRPFAEMAGYGHDAIRYMTQKDSGEASSATFADTIYHDHLTSLVDHELYHRLVIDPIETHGESFGSVSEIYKNDLEAKAVAMAVAAADKLFEASGPRVLERRSFFVGKERMLNPDDLGAVFKYPEESLLGVLTETMVRLGDVNHISNYASDPALLAIAEELHSFQYQFYLGMLFALRTDEQGSLDYLVQRLEGSAKTKELAARLEKAGKRLVAENHFDSTFLDQNGYKHLANRIRVIPSDLAESAITLISLYSQTDSLEAALAAHEANPKGPATFKAWMKAIKAYRNGEYTNELIRRIEEHTEESDGESSEEEGEEGEVSEAT
ncbi:MAG: hypothetical protein ABIH34_08250 [Nanoarchaeota archaeon]